MKTRLFILTICLAVVQLSASAWTKDAKTLTGNSLTEFGKYTIEKSKIPMVVGNQVLETWELSYENTSNLVQIGVVKEKNCTTFIVRTDEFEIQYACNKGVFGVQKIDPKFSEIPKEEMDAKLNRVSYFAQRVICQNQKSKEELLGLIACYFPALINEQYQANF